MTLAVVLAAWFLIYLGHVYVSHSQIRSVRRMSEPDSRFTLLSHSNPWNAFSQSRVQVSCYIGDTVKEVEFAGEPVAALGWMKGILTMLLIDEVTS